MLSRAKREGYEVPLGPSSGLQEENHPVTNVSPSPLPVVALNSQRVIEQQSVRLRLRGRRQPLQAQWVTGGPIAKPRRCADRIGVEGGAGNGLRGPGVEEIIGDRVG